MQVHGPTTRIAADAERILRSLPEWFGIEQSLLEYARNTDTLPTFVAEDAGSLTGFLSLRQHFPHAWEIDCVAVHASRRGTGAGNALLAAAESWLRVQGAQFLQVKTLAPSHPSQAYAETRHYYEAVGFQPLEVLPDFWGAGVPVLVYVKSVAGSAGRG